MQNLFSSIYSIDFLQNFFSDIYYFSQLFRGYYSIEEKKNCKKREIQKEKLYGRYTAIQVLEEEAQADIWDSKVFLESKTNFMYIYTRNMANIISYINLLFALYCSKGNLKEFKKRNIHARETQSSK